MAVIMKDPKPDNVRQFQVADGRRGCRTTIYRPSLSWPRIDGMPHWEHCLITPLTRTGMRGPRKPIRSVAMVFPYFTIQPESNKTNSVNKILKTWKLLEQTISDDCYLICWKEVKLVLLGIFEWRSTIVAKV